MDPNNNSGNFPEQLYQNEEITSEKIFPLSEFFSYYRHPAKYPSCIFRK